MIVFTHASMLAHEPPEGHPERPERLAAVLSAFDDLGLERREAPWAERAAIERVHPASLIDLLEVGFERARDAPAPLDADTWISPGSREAAHRAAGAATAAVDAVMAGTTARAFCAVRPPGHHAEPLRPMGFCVFNNVAIGALHALEAHGLQRVAVVDFDVHHGNGTQAVAELHPNLFFASTHQSPLYPGSGAAHERGPAGNVLNIPLRAGADGAALRAAFERKILPALAEFGPEFLFVSAGFDAHEDDPLAGLAFHEKDYAWAASALAEAAQGLCAGRIVSVLEGGYDLRALARSAHAYGGALMRS